MMKVALIDKIYDNNNIITSVWQWVRKHIYIDFEKRHCEMIQLEFFWMMRALF